MTFLAKDEEIIDHAWASHAGHHRPEFFRIGDTLTGLLVRKFREGQLFKETLALLWRKGRPRSLRFGRTLPLKT